MKPKLKTKNLNEEFIKIAENYVNRISAYKEVIGIAVGGGIGRGHSDEYSDVDIYVYLTSKGYKKWKKNPPIRVGSYKRGKRTVEIEIFDYDFESKSKKPWKIEDRWERNHHIVLFDIDNKVKRLLKRKCVWEKSEKERLLKQQLMRAEWYLWVAEDFVNRGDNVQAHYTANVVIDWIMDIIFLKNNYFIPWPKWKYHYVTLIKNKPKNFERRFKEAMKIKSFQDKDVKRRIRILNKIWKELK